MSGVCKLISWQLACKKPANVGRFGIISDPPLVGGPDFTCITVVYTREDDSLLFSVSLNEFCFQDRYCIESLGRTIFHFMPTGDYGSEHFHYIWWAHIYPEGRAPAPSTASPWANGFCKWSVWIRSWAETRRQQSGCKTVWLLYSQLMIGLTLSPISASRFYPFSTWRSG